MKKFLALTTTLACLREWDLDCSVVSYKEAVAIIIQATMNRIIHRVLFLLLQHIWTVFFGAMHINITWSNCPLGS